MDNSRSILIERKIHNQDDLILHEKSSTTSIESRFKPCCGKVVSGENVISFILKIFPFIRILREYNFKTDFIDDLVAGLTVGVMQIPQGMAYGLLANVQPIYGLYTSFWPVIIYFLFGTSKHISLGAFAITSMMTAGPVEQYCHSSENPINMDNLTQFTSVVQCEISIASTIALICGLFQFLLGIFQFGWIAIFLSEPLTRGFTTGAAIHVFTSQLKYIFGLEGILKSYTQPWKLINVYVDFFPNTIYTNVPTFINTFIFIIMLYLMKAYFVPWFKDKVGYSFPSELLIIAVGTILSHFAFPREWNIKVVGDIPTGIPPPVVPGSLDKFLELLPIAIPIAIVSYANTVSLGKLFASKHFYKIDPNQEFFAAAIYNTFSSFFSCFIAGPSLSRTAVFTSAGAKTQVTGLISSILILIVLMWAGPLFYNLPKGLLACVIVNGLKNMLKQVTDIKRYWRKNRIDLSIWIITFLGTVFLNVDYGLYTGIVYNVITIIYRSRKTRASMLGRLSNSEIYNDHSLYCNISTLDRIKIFRFEGSLIYINVDQFEDQLHSLTKVDPIILKKELEKGVAKKEEIASDYHLGCNGYAISDGTGQQSIDLNFLIIDCSMIADIDSVGVAFLQKMVDDYKSVNIIVYFASCHYSFLQSMTKGNFFENYKRKHVFLTIQDAVSKSVSDMASGKTTDFCEESEDIVNTSCL